MSKKFLSISVFFIFSIKIRLLLKFLLLKWSTDKTRFAKKLCLSNIIIFFASFVEADQSLIKSEELKALIIRSFCF